MHRSILRSHNYISRREFIKGSLNTISISSRFVTMSRDDLTGRMQQPLVAVRTLLKLCQKALLSWNELSVHKPDSWNYQQAKFELLLLSRLFTAIQGVESLWSKQWFSSAGGSINLWDPLPPAPSPLKLSVHSLSCPASRPDQLDTTVALQAVVDSMANGQIGENIINSRMQQERCIAFHSQLQQFHSHSAIEVNLHVQLSTAMSPQTTAMKEQAYPTHPPV